MSVQKVVKLAETCEKKGFDDESFELVRLARELNVTAAPKDSDVEIASWPDFLTWFQSNRGQALTYVFIDTYGEESQEAQQIKQLVDEANAHEAALHEFYMNLRNKSREATPPPVAAPPPPVEPAAEAPAAEEPAAEEEELDLEGLEGLGTETEEEEEEE